MKRLKYTGPLAQCSLGKDGNGNLILVTPGAEFSVDDQSAERMFREFSSVVEEVRPPRRRSEPDKNEDESEE